ncbi:ribosomal RNA processing protein 1 homolog B isoform X1 [Haemorhous mexicanus]|uniref:ribosomal RNA processing protein 1 homolog B isoform X1 n=1 Tax=Haemorhous mexicanus TaxID=30427 RepID=UPI0028BDC8AD|nr:ribosomal RNA processing protein 1 homolog B isoform X1 [Haemorhous mexicanus]
MAPAAVQPPEVQFAQRLAANEKRIRDRALKKLRSYIGVRTQRPGDLFCTVGGFSQEELLKIWKGLFYCMWMQDKPLLQEELAANISQLIHVFQNTETRHLFIQTFWQTMNREWNGIDNLRLDKYYMLMRLILRQSFEVLKRSEWDEGLVEPLLQLLMKEVMDPDSSSPTGIKFHFIDIYLNELAKVGAKELTADQNLRFIEPFCKIAAKSKDRRVLHAVATGVFEMIVDQSPFAIEDLMKELGTNSDEENVSEGGKQENEEMLKTKVADRSLSRKSAQKAENTEDINENADDGIGAVLQFDYKAVADKIFEFASKKNTPSLNRKRLYKLVKKFQDLAEGIFPQDIPEDVSTDEDDDDDESGRRKRKKKAVKPWQQNELEKVEEDKEDLSSGKVPSVPQRKRKKRKKRDSPSADSGTADGNSEEGKAETSGSNASSQEKVPENKKERKRKKLLVNEASETADVATDTRENHSICVQNSLTDAEQNKKSQLKKMNPKVQNVPAKPACQNGPATASAAEDVSPSVTVLPPKAVKKKQKAGAVLVNGDPPVQQTDLKPSNEGLLGTLPRKAGAESAPSRKVTLKTKTQLVGLEGMKVSSQNGATLKKKRKVKEVLNSVEANGVLETVCKKNRKVESSATLSPLKKKKAKPGSDFVKFEKSTVPKAVFFRKARSTISSTRTPMQLNKLQTPSSKRVTFGLNKNMTAEFKKTDKSILVSPEGPSRVAFNPEQKPRHGVLKSPTVTPAKEPQMKRPFTMSAKKRPTAVDFF